LVTAGTELRDYPTFGNSADKLRHPRSVAYSAELATDLGWHCYPMFILHRIIINDTVIPTVG